MNNKTENKEDLQKAKWNVQELLERLDKDRTFLCELLSVYRQDSQAGLQSAKAALGEEFLLILHKCGAERASIRAENIRSAVASKPFPTRGPSMEIPISLGLVLSTDFEGRNLDEILGAADMALYAAKKAGRNCVRRGLPGGHTVENEIHPDDYASLILNTKTT
jgi:Diguanylate cyclase, GGDEF domain